MTSDIQSASRRLAEEQPTVRWYARLFPWAFASAVLAPVTIVLHEVGHLIAARAAGFPRPVLHYSSVDPGAGGPDSDVWTGVIALSGPVMSATLAVVAAAWIVVRGIGPWGAALAITAVSRFVVSVPYTLFSLAFRIAGRQLSPPAFDEYKAGVALGWSGDAVLGSAALVLSLTIWWVGRRLRREERRLAWGGLCSGTAAGWAIWMLLIGPALLP